LAQARAPSTGRRPAASPLRALDSLQLARRIVSGGLVGPMVFGFGGSSAPDQQSMLEKGNNSSNSLPSTSTRPGWEEYNKAEQVNATGCIGGEDPEKCTFIHKLKWDLANSYYWTGNFVRDYFFFIMQWHPLLGILMCHPNHPWTKEQRFYMFLISAGLTFIPSCAISVLICGDEHGHEHEITTIVTTTAPIDGPPASIDEVRAATTHAVSKTAELLLTIVFVTIPDTIFGVILYQLAISETRCGACPCCIPFGKCLMKYTLIFAIVICGVNFGIGMLCLKGYPPMEALEVMLNGKLWSYGTWFIIWMLLPCQLGFVSLWTYEKKEADRLAASRPAAE